MKVKSYRIDKITAHEDGTLRVELLSDDGAGCCLGPAFSEFLIDDLIRDKELRVETSKGIVVGVGLIGD